MQNRNAEEVRNEFHWGDEFISRIAGYIVANVHLYSSDEIRKRSVEPVQDGRYEAC